MARTVADTIKAITRNHLENHNGLLFGQAITAVGWVNNTVPDCRGIVEFPMSDVSNMGIACGAAVAGRRPMIVIRFQDFMWLNCSMLFSYAAKSKEIFNVSTPVYVRALAQEHAGCNHSGTLHNLFMHIPGIRVYSPMTPGEYEQVWEDFISHDDPAFVSEHRNSFPNTKELPSTCFPADVTLIGLSAARFHLDQAAELLAREGVTCNQAHIFKLKPLDLTAAQAALSNSHLGVVVDTGFENCGAAESIAYQLGWQTHKPVRALGLFDRCTTVHPTYRNTIPSPERIAEVTFAALHEPGRKEPFVSFSAAQIQGTAGTIFQTEPKG